MKILFLTIDNINELGGGLKYARELCNILNKEHEVIIKSVKKKNKKNNLLIALLLLFIFKFKIYFICKKFDFIIVNSNGISLFRSKKCKIISIQHNDAKIIHSSFTKRLLKKILFISPSFYNADKILCFDSESVNYFRKNINKKAIYYICPLFINQIIPISNKNNEHKHITYIGRLENRQKNIKLLNEISKFLPTPIRFVGPTNKNNHKKYNNLNFVGKKTYNEIINDVFPTAKCVILTSNFEGLPFACLESLASGIPIVIRNTFLTAKFLINNGNNGILLDKNMNAKEIATLLINTNFNKFDNHKIIQFAAKNFEYSNFINIWKQILN